MNNKYERLMSKDNFSLIANGTAVAGGGTGVLSWLSSNSSPITVIVIITTLVITLIFHIINSRIKYLDLKRQKEVDKENSDRENRKLELNFKLEEQRIKNAKRGIV